MTPINVILLLRKRNGNNGGFIVHSTDIIWSPPGQMNGDDDRQWRGWGEETYKRVQLESATTWGRQCLWFSWHDSGSSWKLQIFSNEAAIFREVRHPRGLCFLTDRFILFSKPKHSLESDLSFVAPPKRTANEPFREWSFRSRTN